MTIDWKALPQWANWVAMDESGELWAYQSRPVLGSSKWLKKDINHHAMFFRRTGISDDWKESLQKRPAYAEVRVDVVEPNTTSDGSTADYYVLPEGATELQDLISHRDMNAQLGEIFRAAYRYGVASHSDRMRDAKKIRFYIEAEIKRLEKEAGK